MYQQRTGTALASFNLTDANIALECARPQDRTLEGRVLHLIRVDNATHMTGTRVVNVGLPVEIVRG